jgi:hypothetical protein
MITLGTPKVIASMSLWKLANALASPWGGNPLVLALAGECEGHVW